MNQSPIHGITRGKASEWRMSWIGSQKEFINGKITEGFSLERFAGLGRLYALGPLDHGSGEVSIFDGTPVVSQIADEPNVSVRCSYGWRVGFLVYAIVNDWRRATVRAPIESERSFAEQLLPFAMESGIDIDQPFPFLIYGRIAHARFHILHNQTAGSYTPELHEKAKVRFSIINERVEILGFYSRRHRGIFTPPDSDFHMHLRTPDNRLAGHLESVRWAEEIDICIPNSANRWDDLSKLDRTAKTLRPRRLNGSAKTHRA